MRRALPDLRPNLQCDPNKVPPGTLCYEYPMGREDEFNSLAARFKVSYEWGIVGVSYSACFALGDYLFAVSDAPALQIWDVSDPSSPMSLASLALDNNPQAIWVSESVCYVVDNGGQIYAINIDNPASPAIEPNGIAQTGENWSHLRAVGDIGVLSGAGASAVALYDLGQRPPREIAATEQITGSQAAFQGRRLFFGDTSGSPRAELRSFRIGGQFCAQMQTYDLYAESQVTTMLLRALHGFFGGELVCDQLTVGQGKGDIDTGSVNVSNYLKVGTKYIGWVIGDPNGSYTLPAGSLLLGDGVLWISTDGTDSGWVTL